MSAAGGKKPIDDTRKLLKSYLEKTTAGGKPPAKDAVASAAGGKPPAKDAVASAAGSDRQGSDRQWPFIKESIERLVYGKRSNLQDFFLKRLKQKEIILKNIMEKSKAPTYEDIEKNRHNRAFSIEHIDPEVGKILESLTKIPFDDKDILRKLNAIQTNLENAIRTKKIE
jgi:hypothetical protein